VNKRQVGEMQYGPGPWTGAVLVGLGLGLRRLP